MEYRCTFVDHHTLFLSFLNVLHGGSLFQRMVAFTAQYGVFSLGPNWSRRDVLSLCGLIAPMLRMLRCSLGHPSVIAIHSRHSIP